jgi:electron transfer flavoprotein beta subunit
MKIIVTVKRVPDTDQRIRVAADGQSIEDGGLPYVVNPFDAIAVEEAIRLRETSQPDAEIVAVGIGGEKYEQELRTALAMGADRAILVDCQQALDPWNVAGVLAVLIERESPGLVLMGKQAVDDDANQAGQFLAARLGWPQATFASRLEFTSDGRLRVARETDQGIETVSVALPAVVTCDLRLNEPRYASLPNILRARKKAIDHVGLEDLQVRIDPRVEVVSLASNASTRSCAMVASVDELIGKLRDEAQVIR